jgi:carbon-monoxide dehydrogenase small subunit
MTETAVGLSLQVNGQATSIMVAPQTLLVDLLREQLGLTGTHVGCDTSQCGACTVVLDGRAVKSCSVLAVQAQGGRVVTVEGLAGIDGSLHPLQEAFIGCHGLQCGFCTPGMLMSSLALLNECPSPTKAQIVDALEGNLCRCTGYVNIVTSVQQAARQMAGQGPGATADTPGATTEAA